MLWGKGAVAGDFVFLSEVEAGDDISDIPPAGVRTQTELVLNRIKKRLEEAGTRLVNIVKFVWVSG